MLSNRLSKLLFALSAIFLSFTSSLSSPVQAEIITLDITAVDPRFTDLFRRAEAFWDARILGYSNTLPRAIQNQLPGDLLIVASTGDFGNPNLLGFAGPTLISDVVQGNVFNVFHGNTSRTNQVAVATSAIMVFNNAFLESGSEQDILDVIIHEMGHALGIGSLWQQNGLLQRVSARGPLQYVGANARRAFAIEAGVAGLGRTAFVPVEQQGGPGTALGHWEDDSPVFNTISRDRRVEIMTGTLVPNTVCFVSRTTLASLVDLHYVVKGFNEDELIPLNQLLGTRPILPFTGADAVSYTHLTLPTIYSV